MSRYRLPVLFTLIFILFGLIVFGRGASTPGGIALTFDDESATEWVTVRDLFRKYDAKATFFVSRFHRLDSHEVEMLQLLRSDGHEIGCHGYEHKSIKRDYGSDPSLVSRYVDEGILPALSAMTSRGLAPTNFSYPFGSRTADYDEALMPYFEKLRGTASKRQGIEISEMKQIYAVPGASDRV